MRKKPFSAASSMMSLWGFSLSAPVGTTMHISVRVALSYLLVGKLGLRAVALATGVGWTCLSVLQLTMLWRIRKKPRAAN